MDVLAVTKQGKHSSADRLDIFDLRQLPDHLLAAARSGDDQQRLTHPLLPPLLSPLLSDSFEDRDSLRRRRWDGLSHHLLQDAVLG